MVRAGVPWSYIDARIVDADRLEQLGEPRRLADLYKKHLGRSMENAHSALGDVKATAEVLAAQLAVYKLPCELSKLHALQWPGQIDPDGRFRLINGVACVAFGKWSGKPMRDVAPSYWDWILSSDFSVDVKALAANAKLGKFPEGV
jgi:DNA polymerase III subunit epsilon